MALNLSIKTGNGAFEEDMGAEVARILIEAAKHIEDGSTEGILQDINGNRVGKYMIKGA